MNIHEKYAKLLVNYCLEVTKGDEVLIRTTYLAAPLLQEMLKEIAIAGGIPVMQLSIEDQEKILLDQYKDHQLKWVDPLTEIAFGTFSCFIAIFAPFNLRAGQNVDPEKRRIKKEAMAGIGKIYSKRTASRDLRRNSCLFPTSASAQEAGMSLKEYEEFVYRSCYLFDDNPIEKWKEVGRFQQRIVDFLNQKEKMRYVGNDIDITFSTKERTWMNSDGKTNMPSGEVYTAPVDDSVNGHIRFSYPGIFQGNEVEDIWLEVKNGEVIKWDARRGKEVLDYVMTIPGGNRFGEAAIGTNMNIQQMTKNILFDEKIGGTIHMALGQAYLQCGGTNNSTIHWDMITDMTDQGEIYADDELIYEKGAFLI